MSFDLGVWKEDGPISAREAQRRYEKSAAGSMFPDPPEVAEFKRRLAVEYPSIDDWPEDDLENCPWSDSYADDTGRCILSIVWGRCEEMLPIIAQLALDCGLIYYTASAH
jgi:hypothetical protein